MSSRWNMGVVLVEDGCGPGGGGGRGADRGVDMILVWSW